MLDNMDPVSFSIQPLTNKFNSRSAVLTCFNLSEAINDELNFEDNAFIHSLEIPFYFSKYALLRSIKTSYDSKLYCMEPRSPYKI